MKHKNKTKNKGKNWEKWEKCSERNVCCEKNEHKNVHIILRVYRLIMFE